MSDEQEDTQTPPPDPSDAVTDGPDDSAAPVAAVPRENAIVEDRYHVIYSAPLPEHDTAGAVAYGAQDTEDAAHSVYALACHPSIPLRHHMLEAHKFQNYAHMACVEASGVLPRNGGGGLGLVLIVRRPKGGLIEWDPEDTTKRISDTVARKVFIPQLLDGLDSLFSRDQTHRRINPRNIFYDDSDKTVIALGECVSEPPGASQPAMFEPLERAIASPNGRGEGGPPDDIYALGVTLYCLLRGGNPLKDLSDAEAIRSRLSKGTWGALGEDTGIPRGIVSLLKGMLNDDPEARWTLREIQLWLEGTAPRARAGRRAVPAPSIPIEYGGQQVPNSRALAYLLAEQPARGARRILEKDFVKWVTNNLRDAPDEKLLQQVVDQANKVGKNQSAAGMFVLARVCRLLDPEGPVRFGSLAFFLDGLGPMLAAAFKNNKKDDLQFLEAGIGGGLLLDAVDQGTAVNTRRLRLLAIQMQDNVIQNTKGMGLERCLYDLCPSLPCQNPVVEPYYATNLVDFGAALEAIAAKGVLTSDVFDRHVVAFIGSQSSALEPQIELLRAAGKIPSATALATLDLLEILQRRFAPTPMPALTSWMCRELDCVMDLIRSKKRRGLMAEKMSSVISGASLTEVARTMDFPSALKRDENEYKDVAIEFANNEIQLRKIRQGVSRLDRMAQVTGFGGVAAIGTLVWALVVVFFVFGGGSE